MTEKARSIIAEDGCRSHSLRTRSNHDGSSSLLHSQKSRVEVDKSGRLLTVEKYLGSSTSRSVHFGVVAVPNLCVELRGYDAADAAALRTSTGGAAATAATVAVESGTWRDWHGAEARFSQLQRTEGPEGSFAFVTPESGLVLVLAAYSEGGDYPAAVRVFPDGLGSNGGGRGVESGRVQVHIDLLEGGRSHAPEALWSQASARENDRSPCARAEAKSKGNSDPPASDSSGSIEEDDDDGAVAQAALSALDVPYVAGLAGETLAHARVALTALLLSSCSKLGWLGADLWETGVAAGDVLRLAMNKAGRYVQESALLVNSPAWFSQGLSELSSWFEQNSTRFWWEEASTRISRWSGQRTPEELWVTWWVRVGGIALSLGLVQQVLVFICRCFVRAGAPREDPVGDGDDDEGFGARGNEPISEADAMVGTFYDQDGKVSRLEIARFDRVEQPVTVERMGGVLSAVFGRSSSNKSRKASVDEVSNGKETEADEFSSMFRALSQPACSTMGPVEGGAEGASQVIVVTQRSWANEPREAISY
ncbi:hypothetical protein Esi_0012_0106 [Ectocarpus siliculosus]|uniref:Uncharacterized protein n=1 Tax=Ectocarpus siliculosus TaxID=2880 RepID=D8LDI7_ECTSI|nr:hypothetical protein Esi_0012_0106 [Ectocarpus siliculosus]|eukprot:CBN74055.1 hypothetical protein Esi_0012_0106 [Ectocarpus siliculosus]